MDNKKDDGFYLETILSDLDFASASLGVRIIMGEEAKSF